MSRAITRVYATKNNKADAATLWKNNIPFYVTPAKVPYWCGWHITPEWRKAHPDVTSVEVLYEKFKTERCNDTQGKTPVFYFVR